MNRQAHERLRGKSNGLASRGQSDAPHVIRRTTHFVRARDIRRPNTRNRHSVSLDVLLGLELVEDLTAGILAGPVDWIILVD